jgi:hypothetical protein
MLRLNLVAAFTNLSSPNLDDPEPKKLQVNCIFLLKKQELSRLGPNPQFLNWHYRLRLARFFILALSVTLLSLPSYLVF